MNFFTFFYNFFFTTYTELSFIAHSATLDEPLNVVDKQGGVILAEQETTTVVTRVQGRTTKSNARAQAYNNDDDWNLEKMLARHNLFATIDWDSTTPVGQPIMVYDVLTDLLQNAISVTPFQRFQRFHCSSINIRLEMIGNRFCQGRLWAVWLPTCLPKSNIAPTFIPTIE